MNINKIIPKKVKNFLKKNFRVGSYPNWKTILKKDRIKWNEKIKASKHGPRVLFATSTGGHRSGNITESALAASLILRGVQADVLLCDRALPGCVLAEYQYVKEANIKKFIKDGPAGVGLCEGCFSCADRMFNDMGINVYYYGKLIGGDKKDEALKISQNISYVDIKSYKYKDYEIGEHAMAGALRFLCVGDLEGQNYAEEILRKYFHASLLTMFAMEALINKYNYECIVFFHGIYIPHGVIGEVARKNNVRVVNWNTAYRQKRFIFTHNDTYHQTLQYEPVSNWENIEWTSELEGQIISYLESRESGARDWQQFNENANPSLDAAIKEIGIDFSKPTIGLLPNVVWDAQLHYKSNSFKNLIEWTIQTIEYFINRPDLQLLLRIHPAEIKRYSKSRQPLSKEIEEAYGKLPSNIFIVPATSKISTYTIMDQCNAVLIYGTKTGVELTSRGIPVIVAGEAWIRNKGFTRDATSPEEYFKILDKLPLKNRMSDVEVTRARKFAYHFFYRRGIYLPFMEKSKDSMSFTLGINEIDGLDCGKSVGLDVICDGIIGKNPFIYPAEKQLEEDI